MEEQPPFATAFPPLTTATKTTSTTSTSCWSNIVKAPQPPKPQPQTATPAQVLAESCKNTKGITVAVIDANAVIQGGNNLSTFADKFVTVPEVLAEIRDPVSRHRLNFVPFSIDSMEPSPDALNKVIKFARATGDLQTLSDVDIKLIALTYTMEAQIHGTNHLRGIPPPVQMVNVKRLAEKDMPGWGSNVPNLQEWEALEKEFDNGSNPSSRILPLKHLNPNVTLSDNHSEDGSVTTKSGESHSENHEDNTNGFRRRRQYLPQKKEISLVGKKMIADGVDASQGQFDDDAGEFVPAVSRSTRRRYLKKKAKREYYEALFEKDCQQDLQKSADGNIVEDNSIPSEQLHQSSEGVHIGNGTSEGGGAMERNNGDEDLSAILRQMRLEEDSLKALQEENINGVPPELCCTDSTAVEEASIDDANVIAEEDEFDEVNEALNHLEIASETNESIDVSCADDDSSEQSWMLRSLSESSVACVTGDFAMQNVLLQMGLRLLAPGGMQIRELHRWVLKCHACYTVTAEIGRIFCPKCGNGGTLRKVAVTVGENGIVLASRRLRITLRGTKFSLPLPQGGRDAIAKNLVLREDQLPQKFLYPKTKKKSNKKEDDFFASDVIFTHHTDKKAPLQPPVRKALAVFSGRRNPNDNHFSRPRH